MSLKKFQFVLALFASATLAGPVFANTWTVNPEQSELGFEVNQGGSVLKGIFETWTANITLDPDAPETAEITAEIQPMSASTGNTQFDTTMPTKDWFDVDSFPSATFAAETVTRVEGSSYRANGTLTIKGIESPVVLDFTLEIEGDTAKATGTASINRFDHGIGAGVGADTVGDIVTVTLDLTATR